MSTKKKLIKKLFGYFPIFLILTIIIHTNQKLISEEILSLDDLEIRIKRFNDWYFKLNPSSKVGSKLNLDGKIILFAKENLIAGNSYLTINKNLTLHSQLIHETPLNSFIRNLEEKYGFDDYLNIIFYLLHEMSNPNSHWKPYLDILPRQPESIAFNYWKRKIHIEEELLNTPILSNFLNDLRKSLLKILN